MVMNLAGVDAAGVVAALVDTNSALYGQLTVWLACTVATQLTVAGNATLSSVVAAGSGGGSYVVDPPIVASGYSCASPPVSSRLLAGERALAVLPSGPGTALPITFNLYAPDLSALTPALGQPATASAYSVWLNPLGTTNAAASSLGAFFNATLAAGVTAPAYPSLSSLYANMVVGVASSTGSKATVSAVGRLATIASPTPAPAPVPVGAIVGGVVGGLAGVALIVGLTIAIIRARAKRRASRERHNYRMAEMRRKREQEEFTGVNPAASSRPHPSVRAARSHSPPHSSGGRSPRIGTNAYSYDSPRARPGTASRRTTPGYARPAAHYPNAALNPASDYEASLAASQLAIYRAGAAAAATAAAANSAAAQTNSPRLTAGTAPPMYAAPQQYAASPYTGPQYAALPHYAVPQYGEEAPAYAASPRLQVLAAPPVDAASSVDVGVSQAADREIRSQGRDAVFQSMLVRGGRRPSSRHFASPR